jgi:hypothetical protein
MSPLPVRCLLFTAGNVCGLCGWRYWHQIRFCFCISVSPCLLWLSFCTSLVHLRFEVGVKRNQRFKMW